MSLAFDLLIYNLFVIFSSFLPVFAYLISKMKFLDGNDEYYAYFVVSLFLSIIIILLVYPTHFSYGVVKSSTPVEALVLYPLFIILASLFMKIKYKTEYSRIISIALILGFLSTEIHELPSFVQEYVNIGIANIHLYQYHYLTHFASICFYGLAVRIAKLKFSKHHLYLFLFVFALTYLCYMVDPYLDFVFNPITGATSFSAYNYFKRFLWFSWLIYVFYDGCEIA